jgi:eukaryotic-like serine/threonine-protein kinase
MQNAIAIKNDSSIDLLSEGDQERVAEIVEQCLRSLEEGQTLSIDEMIQSNPELAEPLRHCLASLQTLHDAVHGSRDTLPHHPALPIDGRLGDFLLGQILGRGGMGIVYAARQLSLDRAVALKILPTNAFSHPKHIQRFLLEAKAAANLHHPHIVPVYAVGEESGIYYYAMQLIEGHTLDQHQRAAWCNDKWRSLLDVAASIANALQYAHDCGIIHRDVKPSNLLIDRNGHVWITDFGLVRRIQDKGLTQSGELVGTANYMSPEQARGKPVDERTDIYSLGITLYELVTGRQAFTDELHRSVLERIESEEPIRPRQINSSISIDLETVVLKAIAKDREERYSSAAEFAADLLAVRDGRAITGRRPSLVKRTNRWVSRHKPLVTVACTGAMACFLTILIASAKVWIANENLAIALTQSQAHEQLAQANYWQCRNLLDHWNQTIVQDLADVPGADPMRSQMLAETITFYESYLARASQDPQLQEDIAKAKLQLASAYQQAGRNDESISHYHAILANVNSPPTPTWSKQQLIARNDLALLLLERGDCELATRHLLEVVDLYQSKLRDGSSDIQDVTGLAAAHLNLARAYHSLGTLAKEHQSLQEAEQHFRVALAREPERRDIRSDLATVRDHQAVFASANDLKAAIFAGSDAVALHQQASTGDERNSPKQRSRLAASLHNFAVLHVKAGDVDRARSHFNESIEIREKLAVGNPLNAVCLSELAVSLNALGMLECQTEEWPSATEAFERAVRVLETLVHDVDRQATPSYQVALKQTVDNLAKLQAASNPKPSSQIDERPRTSVKDLLQQTMPVSHHERDRAQSQATKSEPLANEGIGS